MPPHERAQVEMEPRHCDHCDTASDAVGVWHDFVNRVSGRTGTEWATALPAALVSPSPPACRAAAYMGRSRDGVKDSVLKKRRCSGVYRAPPKGLSHPGGNPGANRKSIPHRCHPILVAFVRVLTKETIELPMGCLQGGFARMPARTTWRPHL